MPIAKRPLRQIKLWFSVPLTDLDLARSQIEAFSKQIPVLYGILLVNAIALAATHAATAPAFLVFVMPVLMGLICVGRMVIWWRRSQSVMALSDAAPRLRTTMRLVPILGFIFTAWSLSLFPYGDAYAQCHVAFYMAITMICCVFCLTHLRNAALLLTVIVVAPFTLFFVSTGQPVLMAIALNLVLVAGGMIFILQRNYRDFANFIVSQRDLKAMVRAQHTQQQIEARFRFATESGGLGVWELDLHSDELVASAVCRENFGCDPQAAFTRDDMCLAIHPDDRDRVKAALAHSTVTSADFNLECRIVRATGKPGWVHMQAQIVTNLGGTALSLAGISLDITERMLSQERIRQSQRVEAVGRLTAGVAHDVNNVLQALLGGIELAKDEVADRPDVFAALELALQAGERGARLTSHLLSFSRQQVLRPTSLDLSPLLTEVAATLTRTLGHDIWIYTNVPANLPHVLADYAHLDSALLNLALNARDAMPRGGDLHIEARATDEQVVITVRDSGEGMTADVLAHACEPFFSTKGLQGSGLGLSMVQGFARQSGGELRIQSGPGEGTGVEIWLPIASRPAMVPQIPVDLHLRGEGRVLVVDDDGVVSLIISAYLRRAGFDVTTATNGREALATLARGPAFGALVTDCAMPGMDGPELVLSARKLYPHLPVLVITGYAGVEGLENLPSDVTIVRKPCQRDDLVSKVKGLIETKISAGFTAELPGMAS